MENKELAVVKEKLQGMSKMVIETTVTNDEQLAEISDKIKKVKQLGSYIKTLNDKLVDPAKEIIARAKEMYDIPMKECKNAEMALKAKAGLYLEKKEAERKAEELKIANKVESGYIKPETAVSKLEALPDEKKKIVTMNSTLGVTKRKVPEIADPNLIPDEYWIIDEVRVRKDALEREKNGQEQIPGVIIKEVSSINSR